MRILFNFLMIRSLSPELAELHKNTTFELFGLTKTPEEAAIEMEKKSKRNIGEIILVTDDGGWEFMTFTFIISNMSLRGGF